MCRQSEKYVAEGSKYALWIGLYLSFHLNWVLDPFVHGRLQNLQTSEVTFAYDITPLRYKIRSDFAWMTSLHQWLDWPIVYSIKLVLYLKNWLNS